MLEINHKKSKISLAINFSVQQSKKSLDMKCN